MEDWNLTSEYLPAKGNQVYIVTNFEESLYTDLKWFFGTREEFDGESGDIIDDRTGEVLVSFPCWCALDLHEDVYAEDLEYYVESEPYAWMELPQPSGHLEHVEEFNNEIENIESLF